MEAERCEKIEREREKKSVLFRKYGGALHTGSKIVQARKAREPTHERASS